MRTTQKLALLVIFAVSGFSALTLQVVWQRVITLHAGVDLFSVTTVVSAFMAGLGLGSLAGGVIADRLGPRRAILVFAASKLGVGVYGLFSIGLLYDGYRAMVGSISSTPGAFLFHFALLIIPTTLMGVSLPLVARGIVSRDEEIAPLVGKLYAINTLGAAVGAAVTAWWLLGTLGFHGAVWVASVLNVVAAVLIFALWRTAPRTAEPHDAVPSPAPSDRAPNASRTGLWVALYGFTGAVALALELVYFRLVDAMMRSNSYTFGHVLTLYLLLFAAGTAVAVRFARRVERPDRWFLWLQFGVGVASLLGVLVLMNLPSAFGMRRVVESYFATEGFLHGPSLPSSPGAAMRLLFAYLLGPLLVMGPAVLLMGASFPFIQALVNRRMDSLGRHTGLLLFANILGNVVGSIVAGFWLIDALGTAGTLSCVSGLLVIAGVAAAWTERSVSWRLALGAAALGGMALLVVAMPTNIQLWAFLHGVPESRFVLVEDRACVNALVKHEEDMLLYLNAASQNGYPYDDYHVLIGLTPSLMHPSPKRAMVVGLGAGSTAYGLAQDPRLDRIRTVEICGGEIPLLRHLADLGSVETARLLSNPRVQLEVGDGRKALLTATDRYDVITVDAMRPTGAYAGNIYSVEFYELVRSRLAPGGLFSQWVPTGRTLQSVQQVFPHILEFRVDTYYGSTFLIASAEPFRFNREAVLERLAQIDLPTAFPSKQSIFGSGASSYMKDSVPAFFQAVEPKPLSPDPSRARVDEEHLNRDLFARDEYFLNKTKL